MDAIKTHTQVAVQTLKLLHFFYKKAFTVTEIFLNSVDF